VKYLTEMWLNCGVRFDAMTFGSDTMHVEIYNKIYEKEERAKAEREKNRS
jgi:hypothetical protein